MQIQHRVDYSIVGQALKKTVTELVVVESRARGEKNSLSRMKTKIRLIYLNDQKNGIFNCERVGAGRDLSLIG